MTEPTNPPAIPANVVDWVLCDAATVAENVAEGLRQQHEYERSTGALDVMTELRRLAGCDGTQAGTPHQCEAQQAVTGGARVRLVIEARVEHLDGGLRLDNGVYIEECDLGKLGLTVLEPGWQPGDIVDDGFGRLVRVVREDGVHLWQRIDGEWAGRPVFDDETGLASLRVVQRAGKVT